MKPSCQVSKISSDVSKARKQFTLKVSWKFEDEDNGSNINESQDGDGNKGATSKSKSQLGYKKEENGGISAGKIAALATAGVVVGALTSGIGLLAGMVVVGMGAAANHSSNQSPENYAEQRVLMLASDSYHGAENWVNAIESVIQEQNDRNLDEKEGSQYRSRKHNPRPEVRLDEVEEWITSSKWQLCDVYQGVRILSLISDTPITSNKHCEDLNACTPPPCMKVNVEVNGSAADTFSAIINFTKSLRAGVIKSIGIVENIDNFSDIIHIKLEPVYLFPSWTGDVFLFHILLDFGSFFVVFWILSQPQEISV